MRADALTCADALAYAEVRLCAGAGRQVGFYDLQNARDAYRLMCGAEG